MNGADLALQFRREFQKLDYIKDEQLRFEALARRIVELNGADAGVLLSRINSAVFHDHQLQWILARCFGPSTSLLAHFPDGDFYRNQLLYVPVADEDRETHELQLLDGGDEAPPAEEPQIEQFASSSDSFLWWQLFEYYGRDVLKFSIQAALIMRRFHDFNRNSTGLLFFCWLFGRKTLLSLTDFMFNHLAYGPKEVHDWLCANFLVDAFQSVVVPKASAPEKAVQFVRVYWYGYLQTLVPGIDSYETLVTTEDATLMAEKTQEIATKLAERMASLSAATVSDPIYPWATSKASTDPYETFVHIVRNGLSHLDAEVDFAAQNSLITVVSTHLQLQVRRFIAAKFAIQRTEENDAILRWCEEHLPIGKESTGTAMAWLLAGDARGDPLLAAFGKEVSQIARVSVETSTSPTAWLELIRPTKELQVLRRNLVEQVYALKDLPGNMTHVQLVYQLIDEPLSLHRWAPTILMGIIDHLSGFDNIHVVINFLVRWMVPEIERIQRRKEQLDGVNVIGDYDLENQTPIYDNELLEWNDIQEPALANIIAADRFVMPALPVPGQKGKKTKEELDPAIRFISRRRLGPERESFMSSQVIVQSEFLQMIARSTSDALSAAPAAAEPPPPPPQQDDALERANAHVPDFPALRLYDRYPTDNYSRAAYTSAKHIEKVFHHGGHGAQTFMFEDHWHYYAYQASLPMEFYDGPLGTRHTNGHLRLINIFPMEFYRDLDGKRLEGPRERKPSKMDQYFPIDLQLLQGLYAVPYTVSSTGGGWSGPPFSSIARFRQFAVPDAFKRTERQDNTSLILASDTEGVMAFRPQPSIFYEAMRLLNSHVPSLHESNKILTVIDPAHQTVGGDERQRFFSRLSSFTAQSLSLPWQVFPIETIKKHSHSTTVAWGTRVVPASPKYEQSRALLFTRDLIIKLPQPNGTVDDSGTAPGSRAIQVGAYIQSPFHVEPVFSKGPAPDLINFVVFLDPWAISVNSAMKIRNDGTVPQRIAAPYLDPLDQPTVGGLRCVSFELQTERHTDSRFLRRNFDQQYLQELTAAETLPPPSAEYDPVRHPSTREPKLSAPFDVATKRLFSRTIRSQDNFTSIVQQLATHAMPSPGDPLMMAPALIVQSYSTPIDYVQGFCLTSPQLKNILTAYTERNMGFSRSNILAVEAEAKYPANEPSFGKDWDSIYHRWLKIPVDPEIVNECISAPTAVEAQRYTDSIERIDSQSGTLRFYMQHRLGHGLYAFVYVAVTSNWLWLRWLKTSQFWQTYAPIGNFQSDQQQEVEMFTEHHDHENRSYGEPPQGEPPQGGGGGGSPPPPSYPDLSRVSSLEQKEILPPTSPYNAPEEGRHIVDKGLFEIQKLVDFKLANPGVAYPKPFLYKVITAIYRWTIATVLCKANSTTRLLRFAPVIPSSVPHDWVLRNLRPPYRLGASEQQSSEWALQDAAWMYSTLTGASTSTDQNVFAKTPSWVVRSAVIDRAEDENVITLMTVRNQLIAVRQTERLYPRFFKANNSSAIDAASYIWSNRNKIIEMATNAKDEPRQHCLGLENLLDYAIHSFQSQKASTRGDAELNELIVSLFNLGGALVPFSELFRVSSADQTVEAYPLLRSIIDRRSINQHRVVVDLLSAFEEFAEILRAEVLGVLRSTDVTSPLFRLSRTSIHGQAIFFYTWHVSRLLQYRLETITKAIGHVKAFIAAKALPIDGESWILQGTPEEMIRQFPPGDNRFSIVDRMQDVWDMMTKSGLYAIEESLVLRWVLFFQQVFYMTEFPAINATQTHLPLLIGRARSTLPTFDDILPAPNAFEQPLPRSLADEALDREATFFSLRDIARATDILRSSIAGFAVSVSVSRAVWPVMEQELAAELKSFPPGTPSATFDQVATAVADSGPSGVYQGDTTAALLPPGSPFNVYDAASV